VLPATVLPVTAALAVEHLGRRLRPRLGPLPALVAALVVAARIPPVVAVPIEVGPTIPPAYAWLRTHGAGKPLIEVPIHEGVGSVGDVYRDGRAMYLATYHRLPLLNGYSGYTPESFTRRIEVARRLPASEALATLCSETGLGWVLLRPRFVPPVARRAWDAPPPGMRVAAAFSDEVIYAVSCEAAATS
jgi:hypothetical protein